MPKYSLILSRFTGQTKIEVFELCKNGQSIFEEFYKEIEEEGNLIGQLAGAISVIELTSNLKFLPEKKFRQLTIKGLNCKVYEAKSGSIRIYLFHEEKTGRVIVTGGKKGDQDEDISQIERIIKNYYDEK